MMVPDHCPARRPKASGPRPTRPMGGRDGAHPGSVAALCQQVGGLA